MRKIVLTVATMVLLYAIAVDAAPKASRPHDPLASGRPQANHQAGLQS
jgi:hypothetical protein